MLPIFPEGGLTSSVITTVWVGVFVLAFFNLRFGWVLSGLVVPGYIVPLLILRPMAAGVIVVEAVITYLIVVWFSERFARGRFNALFGRDRFMGLVLASIAVRASFDGYLLPLVADWLELHANLQFDWHSNLQSFGLVVISLMANQFWKPGLARGLFSAAVVIGITFLIVRYGLMEFTNFRLSGVSYVYEGLASSILASPKAYIILVLTAFIASQMNVRYGWDFSGILIPALIALQWYQPAKVLSSFVEAAVIYFLARAVIRLPWFAAMTIEGARKLVIFFNVSFAYKLLLGHGLNLLDLDVKTTDFYGFGYLLSTLLAIKAYDKDIFPRVMRSTLEVSVAGAAAGNLVGFVLALVLPAGPGVQAAAGRIAGLRQGEAGLLVATVAGAGQLQRAGLGAGPPGRAEERALSDGIELLASGAEARFVAPALAQAGITTTVLTDGMVAAGPPGSGELLLHDPRARSPLAVMVRDITANPGSAAAGLALMKSQGARWLILSHPAAGPRDLARLVRIVARPPELELIVAGQSARGLELAGAVAGVLDLGDLRSRFAGLTTAFDAAGAVDRARLVLGREELAAVAKAANSPLLAATEDCGLRSIPPAITPAFDAAMLGFLRFEVAEPLVDSLERGTPLPEVARRNASLMGWTLDRCLMAGREHWRLAGPGRADGLYLFDPLGERGRMIQSEASSTALLNSASALQGGWKAGSLLLAPDDDHLAGSQRSAFGVISQTLLRARPEQATRLIQLRTARARVEAAGDARTATLADRLPARGAWPDELDRLALIAGGSPVRVDGGRPTAGLEIAVNYSLRYFAENGRGRHGTIWLLRPPLGMPGTRR